MSTLGAHIFVGLLVENTVRLKLNVRCALPAQTLTFDLRLFHDSLPDELRDPVCDVDRFKQFFKTILFSF